MVTLSVRYCDQRHHLRDAFLINSPTELLPRSLSMNIAEQQTDLHPQNTTDELV